MEDLVLERNILEQGSTVINTDVKVYSCTLQELLNSNNTPLQLNNVKPVFGQLVIPEYQRPYVWKEKQISNLLNNIIEHQSVKCKNKPMYYLGSIILHQEDDELKIIDGQQRITTALLINKIVDPTFQSGITYTSGITIKNIKHNLSYLKSIQNGEIFDFREYGQILNSIDFNEINITLIITSTEDLAYTFFETQNTGGVRLSGSDILKAHHLRALPNRKLVNYQAKRWETINSTNLERIVELLTKIRFWDNRKWRRYPFYRDKRGIKSAIIDEYTINAKNNIQDISYYYSAVKNDNGRKMQMHESQYKQIKQPLANGNNTLDYINEYIDLYEVLFGSKYDHRISDDFYEFRKKVLHGKNGTLFLKELFEIAVIAYVSRFGFYRMFEASLWLYRAIFSLRVSSSRNVREDSVFKFVYDNQFIDNIIEVFTPDELFLFLKKFRYNFNSNNILYKADSTINPFKVDDFSRNKIKPSSSKILHVKTLKEYFGDKIKSADIYAETPSECDKNLTQAIATTIKATNNE
jgi:uncharacterized protein with ParB-like and HNH nuclease domain